MAAVDISITDDSVLPQPLADVAVTVLTNLGTPVTAATSDANGLVALSLPAGSYEVRFYKLGVVFGRPLLMDVVEPSCAFYMTGTRFDELPLAVDPRCCRCTGRFMSLSNKPLANVTLRVMPRAEDATPKVIDGRLVAGETIELKTDRNGIVSVDLIRGGRFCLMYAGESETVFEFVVPDRANANLIDLLFPAPVSLTWGEAPISLAVGQTKKVQVSVLFTDHGVRQKNLTMWAQFTNSDGRIASVWLDTDTGLLSITGLRTGTCEVAVELMPGLKPNQIPNYSLAFAPLLVTVA